MKQVSKYNTQHRNSKNTIPKRINVQYKLENMKMLQVINLSYKR